MHQSIEDRKFKIIGYKVSNEQYNLANEFRRVIQKSFNKYPAKTLEEISEELGICARTLHRVCKCWNISIPKKEERKRKDSLYLNNIYGIRNN